MTLTASRVADELERTAGFLREHGDNTAHVVHDLALGASHSSDGPGQRNAISDPTGNTATAPPDPLAQLEQRWWNALHSLLTAAFDVLGGNTPTEPHQQATALAAHLRARNVDKPLLGRLHRLSVEIDHVIYECVPTDREAAEEQLRERHYVEMRARDCEACESPTDGTSTKLVAGLCRPGCYDLEQRQVQRGTFIDRTTTVNNIRAGVARGEINRPASPYWRTSVPTIHEESA